MNKTMDSTRFRRKVTFSEMTPTRLTTVEPCGRKDIPRPRSRSLFTSASVSEDLPPCSSELLNNMEGPSHSSWLSYVPKPIIVKNYFAEDFNDFHGDQAHETGGTTISSDGVITMRLRDKIRVDISPEKAVRIVNAKNNIVLALSSSGASSGMIHPNGRVFQYGSRVEIIANDAQGNHKSAKMWYKGVSFSSISSALVYLVDSAGTRTTTDNFNDLSNMDFTMNIFYEESPYMDNPPSTSEATRLVNKAVQSLEEANYWVSEDGTNNWIINSVRISQTSDGLVRVGRNSNKFSLRTSPTNGSASISSPYVHCTGSMGQTRHLFVRRGERRMHYDGQTFIVRNAGHSAGFDEKHQLKVY